MTETELEMKLKKDFPGWKVVPSSSEIYPKPLYIVSHLRSRFDIKMYSKNEIVVEHSKKVNPTELESLVNYLKKEFKCVVVFDTQFLTPLESLKLFLNL